MSFIILLLLIVVVSILIIKFSKKTISFVDGMVAFLYFCSFVLFIFSFLFHLNGYNTAIDPIDGECYSPIGSSQFLTVFVFQLLFFISLFLVWRKGIKLPPLTLVLCFAFIILGILLNGAFIIQVSHHNTESLTNFASTADEYGLLFIIFPLFTIGLAITLLVKTTLKKALNHEEYQYKNPKLQYLNNLLNKQKSYPLMGFILAFPFFILITLILVLFGQEADAMIHVFSDTTTWRFSQKSHPPVLDHQGHYLCTVAAKGSPNIVKPIRIGRRNQAPIIVNRQLMIANAFEKSIEIFSPKLHRFIRNNYDRYGYNLSLKILSEKRSNITYILMKPLEWCFLIHLYLCIEKPETLIKKQYT